MKTKTQNIIVAIIIILGLSVLIKFIIFPLYIAPDIEKSCLENINNEIAKEGLIEFLERPGQPLEIVSERAPSSVNSVANYFICNAIVNDDVSKCEKLNEIKKSNYDQGLKYDADSYLRACEDFLEFFVDFLNKAEKDQRCEQETINNCIQIMEGNSEKEKETKCKNFCRAYLAKDISICSESLKTKVNSIEREECLALITGDINYCKNLKSPVSIKQCMLVNQYLNAIKGKDKNGCKFIQENPEAPNFKMLCNLYFDKNTNICRKELEVFEKNYCESGLKIEFYLENLLKNILSIFRRN